eukprot:m.5020 g.5020  ORF g.5020 m.5020 type:complete len:100 (-) comp7362_c0_seq2:1432-1731(-)
MVTISAISMKFKGTVGELGAHASEGSQETLKSLPCPSQAYHASLTTRRQSANLGRHSDRGARSQFRQHVTAQGSQCALCSDAKRCYQPLSISNKQPPSG